MPFRAWKTGLFLVLGWACLAQTTPVSPGETQFSHLPAELLPKITEHLSTKDLASFRLITKNIHRDVVVRKDEWFARQRTTNPFRLYRLCIKNREALVQYFSAIPECWDYVNEWYPTQLDQPESAASSLTKTQIQLLYDVVADRFSDLDLDAQMPLIQFLMRGAPSWPDERKRTVLYYVMQFGSRRKEETADRKFKIPQLAWSTFCASQFYDVPTPPPASVPRDMCLRSAFILKRFAEPQPDILNLLHLRPQEYEYFFALESDASRQKAACFWIAVEKNDVEAAENWFAQGADPNSMARNGQSVLLFAVARYQKHMVRKLLEWGACPNTYHAHMYIPFALHFAVRGKMIEIARLLLDGGADPNLLDKNGRSAISFATDDKSVALFSLLAAHGAILPVLDN